MLLLASSKLVWWSNRWLVGNLTTGSSWTGSCYPWIIYVTEKINPLVSVHCGVHAPFSNHWLDHHTSFEEAISNISETVNQKNCKFHFSSDLAKGNSFHNIQWFLMNIHRSQVFGVFKLFSWRPKFKHQNLTRPKREEKTSFTILKLVKGVRMLRFTKFINGLGYFGHNTPQVLTFMAFLFLKCWFYVYGNMFYELWGGFYFIIEVPGRPATQTSSSHDPSVGRNP